MLKSIYIDNFKSLVRFQFPSERDSNDKIKPIERLSAVIGLNGAGKTTFLQVLDFLRALVTGRVRDWLKARDWNVDDLFWGGEFLSDDSFERFSSQNRIRFSLVFDFYGIGKVYWNADFSKGANKCIRERCYLHADPDINLLPENVIRRPMILIEEITDPETGEKTFKKHATGRFREEEIKYEGSILSILDEKKSDEPSWQIKNYLLNMRSFELFSPQMMRQPSEIPDEGENMGRSGEKLSGFVAKLTEEQRASLLEDLKIFYPGVKALTVREVVPGYFEIVVEDQHTTTGARHLNDGMLRILAILAQMQTEQSCVLLEEIENGINPEMIARLVKYLLNAPKQVIFTTHSPLILNYMPDERAKESVFLVYKTPQGVTRAQRFFGIPRMAKKLSVMGPGDAFVDTDLEQLVEELNLNASAQEAPDAVDR